MQSVVAQRDVTIAKMIKDHKQSFDAKKPARDLLDQFFLDQVCQPTPPHRCSRSRVYVCACAYAADHSNGSAYTTEMLSNFGWPKSAVASCVA